MFLSKHVNSERADTEVVYEKEEEPDGSKSQRVDIHYKFIGYVDINEMLGMPMAMAMAKDVEIDDALITETKVPAKELAG